MNPNEHKDFLKRLREVKAMDGDAQVIPPPSYQTGVVTQATDNFGTMFDAILASVDPKIVERVRRENEKMKQRDGLDAMFDRLSHPKKPRPPLDDETKKYIADLHAELMENWKETKR